MLNELFGHILHVADEAQDLIDFFLGSFFAPKIEILEMGSIKKDPSDVTQMLTNMITDFKFYGSS